MRASGTTGRQMQILLVEDSEADAFLTQAAFETLTVPPQFTVCADGLFAIEHLQGLLREQHPLPDLLLVDINMPRMDGFELIAYLKSSEELRHLPILVFSTSSAPQDVRRSYESHASSYICKPVSYPDYDRVVQAVEAFWMNTARLPS